MLKEALQYILDGMRPETQDLCGRAYVITPSGAQEVIETPIVPATLQLHSLDSIVKMIRTEAIHLADANTPALFVNIPSPTNVTCFSQPDFTQRCVRAVFYSAGATDVPGWDAKVTLGFEEAQIALRTRFQETGDSLYAMKLVNDISLGAKVIYNDNGVATTVTTKSGVSLQTNEAIRPIVKLRPYADQEPVDTTALAAEVTNAEEMRKHLNEYQRMVAMQAEVQDLTDQSAELTRKIELARELPATILAEAHIPVEGLTVENGIPLINGLPISNLSDGELLELCVDISVCKPGQLEIILIDGAERLDKESRERLYAKCKAKGLQLIATRVTDSEELEVTEL